MGCRFSILRFFDETFGVFLRIVNWFQQKVNAVRGGRTALQCRDNEVQADNASDRVSLFQEEMDSLLCSLKADQPKNFGSNVSLSKEVDHEQSLKDFQDSLKPTEEEIEKERQLKEREKKLKTEMEEVLRRIEEIKKDSESVSEMDDGAERRAAEEEFQRQLDEQERVFRIKLEEIRERRREIEREAEEEMRRIREKSAMRMMMFQKCIQMKLHFEEKEDEWRRMLERLRRPIVDVCTSYYDLQDELRNAVKEELTEFDKENVANSGKSFGRKVAIAQETMYDAFNFLDAMSRQNEDRIFIKIIMKSLSDLGYQCNFVGQQLVEVLTDPTRFDPVRQLDIDVSKLSAHHIPTTAYLRQTAPNSREEDYQSLSEPPYPNWFSLLF